MTDQTTDYNKPVVAEPEQQSVRVHKRTFFDNFVDTFLAQDIHEVITYLHTDVVIPAIKKTLVEIIKNGADMLFYGETKASRLNDSTSPWTSYNAYYQSGPKGRRSTADDRDKNRSDNYRIEFPTRGQAEAAKDDLLEIFRTYPSASIADFCEIVRQKTDKEIADQIPAKWNDNDWGWYDLKSSDCDIVRLFNGYYTIRLPRPVSLK